MYYCFVAYLVQDLLTKIGLTLDKLEMEWAEVNTKLPPSIEEAHHAVGNIQVHDYYRSSVILFDFSSLSVCYLPIVML